MQVVDAEVITDAVELACRAPSFHNSQPWNWVAEGPHLHLHLNPGRRVRTDRSGREALLSCGAVLDHLLVAMAAAGWTANVDRFPDPTDRNHVASIAFSPRTIVTDGDSRRAEAIRRRRTDRLPFAAPTGWSSFLESLRHTIGENALLDVIAERARPQLAEASRLTEAFRTYDSAYHAELYWWTAPCDASDGVPWSSLVSADESDRVDIGRNFPVTGRQHRRPEVSKDQSKIVVLSSRDDSRKEVLGCGETLSAVLLECTAAGMATCTLTHLTEVPASREVVSALIGHPSPQVLIRVGATPDNEQAPPPTPRLPLADVLRFCG